MLTGDNVHNSEALPEILNQEEGDINQGTGVKSAMEKGGGQIPTTNNENRFVVSCWDLTLSYLIKIGQLACYLNRTTGMLPTHRKETFVNIYLEC